MRQTPHNQRQGLIFLSRCLQKPGSWIVERIVTGQLSDALRSLFPESSCQKTSTLPSCPLTELLSLLASYQCQENDGIQRELLRQYTRWTTVEANTIPSADSPSPFKEAQDPLVSYRHLPGQEIMEWYHCCGMKIPKRFMVRPDSLTMKLEFAVYLAGNVPQHPEDPDHSKIYQAYLHRFFLPHIEHILSQRCGQEQFPFYYLLCALLRVYLT